MWGVCGGVSACVTRCGMLMRPLLAHKHSAVSPSPLALIHPHTQTINPPPTRYTAAICVLISVMSMPLSSTAVRPIRENADANALRMWVFEMLLAFGTHWPNTCEATSLLVGHEVWDIFYVFGVYRFGFFSACVCQCVFLHKLWRQKLEIIFHWCQR